MLPFGNTEGGLCNKEAKGGLLLHCLQPATIEEPGLGQRIHLSALFDLVPGFGDICCALDCMRTT